MLALLLFLAGMLLVLVAILQAMLDMRNDQTAIEYEVKRVAVLKS